MKYDHTRTFGENLKRLIKEKGITQKEFAAVNGFAPETVSVWVNNKAVPSGVNLKKIFSFFDIPLTDISPNTAPLYLKAAVSDYSLRDLLARGISSEEPGAKDSYKKLNGLWESLTASFSRLNINGKLYAIEFLNKLASMPEYNAGTTPDKDI